MGKTVSDTRAIDTAQTKWCDTSIGPSSQTTKNYKLTGPSSQTTTNYKLTISKLP